MPDIEMLKKQLRGIRSTQKLTKAMKTASTVKFSKLKSVYGAYNEYGRECADMLEKYGTEFSEYMGQVNAEAPVAVIVMASNRGLCAKFNSEIFELALSQLKNHENFYLVACSKKAVSYFASKKVEVDKSFIISDVPAYEETSLILDEIIDLRKKGEISSVYVVYSQYYNMLSQKPSVKELFSAKRGNQNGELFCVPDRSTIISQTAQRVFKAMFYELALETAMGAQGSTLMTMRSAYDTATEYCENLESEINHIRQSSVTADVIETSSEHNE
ncbi:MAG: F0F1 ATP synthase subunit gamma [Acutalibacteraceae bacterium]